MPLLTDADEVYIGTEKVDQIYLDNTPVWTFGTVFTETLSEPLGAFVSGSISTS